MNRSNRMPHRVAGIVLPVTMIMLVALGLLSASALQIGRTAGFMTVGYQHYMQTFYQAEQMLETVESTLVKRVVQCGDKDIKCLKPHPWLNIADSRPVQDGLLVGEPPWRVLDTETKAEYAVERVARQPDPSNPVQQLILYRIRVRVGEGANLAHTYLSSAVVVCLPIAKFGPDCPVPGRRVSWQLDDAES